MSYLIKLSLFNGLDEYHDQWHLVKIDLINIGKYGIYTIAFALDLHCSALNWICIGLHYTV